MEGLIRILKSGDYQTLLTYKGITTAIAPLLPIILVLELIRGLFYKKFKVVSYKIPFYSYLLDSYFGEITALAGDVYRAPGIKNKFLYIFMPPGWSHTGDHKTSTDLKRAILKEA